MAARFLDRAFLESRFGATRILRLADEAAADGGTSDEAVDAAIAAAEADAFSRLTGRYADSDLPTDPDDTPAVLKEHVAAYALQALSQRHDIIGTDVERVVGRADKWFSGVAAGRFAIGLAGAPAVDSSEPLVWSSRTVGDEVFGQTIDEEM